MNTRRSSLLAVAAAFAVSSSFTMLQSARPALADADDHHPRHMQRHDGDRDRDDRRASRPGYHWYNGQWTANNGGHWVNGQWVSNPVNWSANNGKHKGWKHKKRHDRDHDGDGR